MSLTIGAKEKCNLFVVEMAALLHDLDDWKLTGPASQSLSKTEKWLAEIEFEADLKVKIIEIINEVSYKGAGVDTPVSSVEAAVVQDADRLDAIGAIGIARTFAYGGHKNRLIYDPEIPPELHDDFQVYKNSKAPTINHFYEKLLLLKDRMNTETARQLAVGRHEFMKNYLNQFFKEWEAVL